MKYIIGILREIALNLQMALSSMDILMMSILLIHEHSMCFHLFISSLISSLVSYNFLSMGHLHPWLSLFLGIFVLFFDAIINGIVFLVSLSDNSLLVYKNAIEFWTFILYPATLIYLSVLVVFWWNL